MASKPISQSQRRPKVSMSEEQFDAHLNLTAHVAKRDAYESMAFHLRRRAGEAFANGKDEQATLFRKEAEDTDEHVKVLREEEQRMKASYRAEYGVDW